MIPPRAAQRSAEQTPLKPRSGDGTKNLKGPVMSHSVGDQIGAAVNQNTALSTEGLLERAFGWLFRGLVYAQIWEDPVADMDALQIGPGDNVVCIGSGGCNMMSYLTARPDSITVVDLSPAHVALNRLKLSAARTLPGYREFYMLFGEGNRPESQDLIETYLAPEFDDAARAFWTRRRRAMFKRGLYGHGALGQTLKVLHLVTWIAGVRWRDLLEAKTLEAQQAFFDRNIAPLYRKRLVRFLCSRRASLFGLGIPPAQFDKLAADAGGDIVAVLTERTRKLFCDFPIAENYFAWQAATRAYAPGGTGPVPPYLEERHFETLRAKAGDVSVHNRSFTDLLAEAPAGSKSVYVLLDAQDWMNDDQLNALWSEITRTAAPGARVLFRTGGAPDILPGRVAEATLGQWDYDAAASETAFKSDRSAIYGGVHVYRLKGTAQ